MLRAVASFILPADVPPAITMKRTRPEGDGMLMAAATGMLRIAAWNRIEAIRLCQGFIAFFK
jgi:hypothetical protein